MEHTMIRWTFQCFTDNNNNYFLSLFFRLVTFSFLFFIRFAFWFHSIYNKLFQLFWVFMFQCKKVNSVNLTLWGPKSNQISYKDILGSEGKKHTPAYNLINESNRVDAMFLPKVKMRRKKKKTNNRNAKKTTKRKIIIKNCKVKDKLVQKTNKKITFYVMR